MNTTPADSKALRWMQTAVSGLLPPAYRETVLGDLEERFNERTPGTKWIGYAGDVVTTVPQVSRSQIRRLAAGSAACAAASGDLRSRAEHLQMQIWIRNVVVLFSVIVTIASFLVNARGEWRFHETVVLAMTIGWIGGAWQLYGVRGRSTGVPGSLSFDELSAFHRRELARQMNVGVHRFVYWCAPAVLLILYGLFTAVPGFRGAVLLLASIGLQIGAVTWAEKKQQRAFKDELDGMEQEADQA